MCHVTLITNTACVHTNVSRLICLSYVSLITNTACVHTSHYQCVTSHMPLICVTWLSLPILPVYIPFWKNHNVSCMGRMTTFVWHTNTFVWHINAFVWHMKYICMTYVCTHALSLSYRYIRVTDENYNVCVHTLLRILINVTLNMPNAATLHSHDTHTNEPCDTL